MNVVAYIVSALLFFGSFVLFGYADLAPYPFQIVVFTAGIVGVSIALAIPFHLLKRLD